MGDEIEKGGFNQADTDSDPNAFQRMRTELRTSIFRMMSLIIKEHEVPLYIGLILPIIEFFQVMGYAFYNQDVDVWRFPDVSNVFHQFFGHLRLVPYFKGTNFTIYTMIFYIVLGFGVTVVLGLVYTYYIASKRKPLFSWPLIAVRFILAISSNILFLPKFDYMVSILSCSRDREGVVVHSYFSDTTCWQRLHLVNAIFAVIGNIAFIVILLTTTLIFFEARPLKQNSNAKIHSRAFVLFNLHKIILVLLFTFLPNKEYQITLMAYLLIGSTVVFVKFQFRNPFYNEIIMKAWSTMAAINLWTVLMLIFAKIMESSEFKEAIFVWLVGIPLVVAVNLSTVDKRLGSFLINTDRFQTGFEVIWHIQYLEKLLKIQNVDRNASFVLDGYLEIHKQECSNEQCPCKSKNKALNNNRITRNLLNNDSGLSEKEAVLIYLIYQLYTQGMKTFPNHSFLIISYSFFLLNRMMSKQQALQVFMDAEQKSFAIDAEFIVYRYKKLLEDEMAESQQEEHFDNGLDLGNESSFQNHMRMCQANIEKSALLHMEFWSQLSEDQPDLTKLEEIGTRISILVKSVENQWNKLFKINPNNVKAIRMFGKYLIDITHNKEKGEELIEKANNFANINHGKKNINYFSANQDLEDEATPIIIVSGEQEKFGMVTNINLAAASLFGFNKSELLGRKLSTLMPSIYSKFHDVFIEKYLQTNEGTIINKSKERFAFGKTKSAYIFPFHYNVKAVPSMLQGVQFIATLRIERKLRNTAFVITNTDGAIDSISSSCISLLKMDKSFIQKKAKIQEYVPNIIDDRASLFNSPAIGTQATAQITFNYPTDSEFLNEDDAESVEMNCSFSELLFLNGKENAGFVFKFERMPEPSHLLNETLHPKAKISNFQFRFDRTKPLVVGEYMTKSTLLGESGTPDSQDIFRSNHSLPPTETGGGVDFNMLSSTVMNRIQVKEEDEPREYTKVEYGIGVRTYQLIAGEVRNIEEDEDEEENETEKERRNGMDTMGGLLSNTSEENIEDGSSIADFGNAAKSRKIVSAVINDKRSPMAVRRLNWVIHLLAAVLIGFSVWSYANLVSKLNDLSQIIRNIEDSREMIADMMIALSNLKDLSLVGRNLFDNPDVAGLQLSLQSSLDAATQKKETLEREKSTLTEEHQNLFDNPVVSLRSLGGGTTLKGLIQATEDIITRGLTLAYTPPANVNPANADFYFVTTNLENEYFESLVLSSELYVNEFLTQTQNNGGFPLILSLSCLATLIALLISIRLMYLIKNDQDKVLRLFMDIPDKTVKTLYSKCENFVSNLQIGEDDDLESELDQEEAAKDEEQDSLGFLSRKKKKKFKNFRKSYWGFFIGFLILAVLLHAPFIYSQAASNTVFTDISAVAIEFNSTTYAEFYFGFTKNIQRQMFIDSTVDILSRDNYDVVVESLDLCRKLNSYILGNNSINIKSHTAQYNDLFNQIFYQDPCSVIQDIDSTSCETFAENTASKGMALLLVRQLESFNILFGYYAAILNGDPLPYDPSYMPPSAPDTTENRLLGIMRTPRAMEIEEIQQIYINGTFRQLINQFQESLDDHFEDFKTVKLLTFILFLALLLVIYIFAWIPLITRLNSKIWKTKSMLVMIPISVIVKIKTIRTFLRNIINENHLLSYSA